MRISRNFNDNKTLLAHADDKTVLNIPANETEDRSIFVALAGNPNSGKTTIFNAITGGRQKTGNYAGVTIEKKEGIYKSANGRKVRVIDLPGLYSLSANSPEEKIAQDVLLGTRADTRKPDVAIVVVDASNMERNLYLAIQVKEVGVPVVVALNMMDIANNHGLKIDTSLMERKLGVPVIEMTASSGKGVAELKSLINEYDSIATCQRRWQMDGETEAVVRTVSKKLIALELADACSADWLARRYIFHEGQHSTDLPDELKLAIHKERSKLSKCNDDLLDDEVIFRYRWIRQILADAVNKPLVEKLSKSERTDKIFLHKIIGPVIFLVIMTLMFQAIFTWSSAPMDLLTSGVTWIGEQIGRYMPEGELKNLLLEGVIAGVGNVIVFLPQIVILFFFIALLEDTGYLARAAFLLDRLMGKVGLNGHAFIPLLSSFACAIPGILSTRTIRNEKDRFITILIAPLMTCSARLPVYTLLIGAFFPQTHILGIISSRGLVMLALYIGAIFSALLVALILKKFVFKGERSPLILEMPSYKLPRLRNVAQAVFNSSWAFIKKAGTVILVLTIILWFMISHPKNEDLHEELLAQGKSISEAKMAVIKNSYMGTIGQTIEPIIRPLGYDWKIGVGLISAFAAREVIVGTMAIIYSAGSEEDISELRSAMKNDTDPETGKPVWTPLVAASMLVFFVFALMCVSTIATIRKETQTWKWPAVAFLYTLILAYVGAFIVYQGGLLIGLT